jgi:hypothetical protein
MEQRDRVPKRMRVQLATTFSKAEVQALLQLFQLCDRGANIAVVLKSDHLVSLRQKFAKMKLKLELMENVV